MNIKIKASHITSLTDARYFAAKEVEWLSFNFTEGTSSYIEPMKARAIIEWVTVPNIVGEFSFLSADEINFYTEGWGLQVVQVGIFTPISTVIAIKNADVIKEIKIDELTEYDLLIEDLLAFSPYVQAFQLNFDTNNITWADIKNQSTPIDIKVLKSICKKFKIILSIDFEPFMLNEILALNLYGLNLKGGEEERTGVKSFDELDDIFDMLENNG